MEPGAQGKSELRVLVVEDDSNTRFELLDVLTSGGFDARACASAWEARREIESGYDLVLLDVGLPDGDGLELCRELRRAGDSTPVIVVTAHGEPERIVRGLDTGADDYLTKPFDSAELLARVRSVMRRAGPKEQEHRLSVGAVWLDTQAYTCGIGNRELTLTPREFELLAFFLRFPQRAWTREQIIERVWSQGFVGDERTVDLHVARLRAAIEKDPRDPQWIETVWRIGYRFREPER